MERFYYSLASGSAGNCGLLVLEDTHILIDLGISVRKLKAGLQRVGLTVEDLDAVLITHEHTDHIKGLATFIKKYEVAIYASDGTVKVLQQKYSHAGNALIPYHSGAEWTINGVKIKSFTTSHDAAESTGYIICAPGIQFGYATDLGRVTSTVRDALLGSTTVVLESNHDMQMLRMGPYPYALQQRVAGEIGHLSNTDCAQFAAELVQCGTRQIILAHLSEKNNTPECAKLETEALLLAKGLTCEVYVATPTEMEPLKLQEGALCLCCPSA